jgi:hypothetical protein
MGKRRRFVQEGEEGRGGGVGRQMYIKIGHRSLLTQT